MLKTESYEYADNVNLIELYLSAAEDYYFVKGCYYDPSKKAHELIKEIHLGMFRDSVLLRFLPEDELKGYACRYFPNLWVKFYDTMYGQGECQTRMLIHNTGKEELVVCFDGQREHWVISSGSSRIFTPELKRENPLCFAT